MRYLLLLFLEGIITFISPCILPMVPIYISYFMGAEGKDKFHTLRNALAFVFGFTVIFTLLGAAAGTIGIFFKEHMRVINIVSGLLMILFGLNFIGIFNINLLNRTYKLNKSFDSGNMNFVSTFLFGCIFGIGWTPCVGPFLGTALMIASNADHVKQSALMLLVYSLGLGVPFILSAVLIHLLTGTFNAIKKHYRSVKIVSGVLLILIGILMASEYLNVVLSVLTF